MSQGSMCVYLSTYIIYVYTCKRKGKRDDLTDYMLQCRGAGGVKIAAVADQSPHPPTTELFPNDTLGNLHDVDFLYRFIRVCVCVFLFCC